MRAAQATALMQGSDFVRPDDVQAMAAPVLAHRLMISAQGKLQGIGGREVIEQVLRSVAVPLAVETR